MDKNDNEVLEKHYKDEAWVALVGGLIGLGIGAYLGYQSAGVCGAVGGGIICAGIGFFLFAL